MKTYINFPSREFYNVVTNDKTVTISTVVDVNLDNFPSIKLLMKVPEFSKRLNRFLNTYNFTENVVYNPDNNTIGFGVIGQSTCSENDTFDKDLGFKIAETKMHENAFKVVNLFYEHLATFINNLVDTKKIEDAMLSCVSSIYENHEHANNLGGVVEDYDEMDEDDVYYEQFAYTR